MYLIVHYQFRTRVDCLFGQYCLTSKYMSPETTPNQPLSSGPKRRLRFPGKHRTVDVGGGAGEFLLDSARAHPEREYLVIDPAAEPIQDKPENLHLIRWRGELGLHLPLPDHSVDKVHLNFVMGEIRGKEEENLKATPKETAVFFNILPQYRTPENEIWMKHDSTRMELAGEVAVYARIIRNIRDVLLPSGSVSIIDVQGNIPFIQCALEQAGFQVITGPSPLPQNSATTKWTKFFMEQFHKSDSSRWTPETSPIRPIMLTARIIP